MRDEVPPFNFSVNVILSFESPEILLEGLPLRFRHNQATEDKIRIALNGIARRCGTTLVKKQNLHSKPF